MNKPILWGICLASALLVACGSDGDDAVAVPATPSDAVPEAVAQSEEGMVSWVGQLASEGDDSKQAFDVARFTPPTAENTEPVALR